MLAVPLKAQATAFRKRAGRVAQAPARPVRAWAHLSAAAVSDSPLAIKQKMAVSASRQAGQVRQNVEAKLRRRLNFFAVQARHYARPSKAHTQTHQQERAVTDGEVVPAEMELAEGDEETRGSHEPLPLHYIFKVFAVVTPPNYFLPWQKKTSKECVGSGFVVETPHGVKLLTNAHVVAHATTVRIRRSGSSQMYRAKIKAISFECDLAELEVQDPMFWKESDPEFMRRLQEESEAEDGPGKAPEAPITLSEQDKHGLKLVGLPELHSRVTVAGYPTGGDNISVTRGVVSRIEPQPYAFSPLHQLLAIQIDAAINPGNSGGPALDDKNRVVGVAFQALQGADNIGYIIPVPIVNHFLEDFVRSKNKVEGFVRIGVNTQMLDNVTAARTYFNMKKSMTGILVALVDPVSDAAEKLKKDDILLSLDEVPIANDGTVPFRKRERISFDYLLMNKYVGDSCKVGIWRDSKKLQFDLKLKPKAADLVPVYAPEYEKGPPYMVFGGLVFGRLTLAYLGEYGDEWWNQAPRPLVNKAMHEYQKKKDQEIVILSHVLVDECNFGYNHFMNLQLKTFNGVDVLNLKHLDELLTSNTSEYARFEMDEHVTVILRHKDALEAATRIQENHGVPALKSKHFLPASPADASTFLI